MNYEIGLYKHNASAYQKVKNEFNKSNKACIVHATGTGKSFIALQLIYDFIKENPNRKVVYLTPLNGIKEQLKGHITAIEKQNQSRGIPFHKEYFDNVKFITYASVGNNALNSLDSMSRDDLSHLKADMMILDEFHHIGQGADNWKAGVEIIEKSNPDIKIFGMSATSVRNRGTSKEEDVAETYFEGHIASEYPIEQAIADKTLPVPNYHAAYTFLTEECKELEEKVKNGNATQEEKKEYEEKIRNIKKEISKLDNQTIKDIVSSYIKPEGKYIYFCPSGSDIKELQKNFLSLLPENIRENVEFYQVHSSNYSSKENIVNANNFYNNISSNGQSSINKLRIMFAIDMYNEGIHVPDIDGVIMGRNTNSDIIYYQQLGRALAVKKKDDNDNTVLEPPLVLDLQDNFRRILNLYFKVKGKEINDIAEDIESRDDIKQEIKNKGSYNPKDLLLQFGIEEQIINIVSELNEIKEKIELSLTDDEKIEEIYKYYQETGKLPSTENNQIRFSDNSAAMGQWISHNRTKIMELSQTNEHARKIAELKGLIQGLCSEDDEKIEEIHKYYQGTGKLPSQNNREIRFSDNSAAMGQWIKRNKTKIMELSQTNEHARKIAELKGWLQRCLEDDEKIEEIYKYYQETGKLPSTENNQIRFSDNSAAMGQWISHNRTKIMELSQTNEHARKIAQAKGLIQGLYLEDDEKIEEIHKYYQGTGKLPSNRDKEIRFSDNSAAMGIWIQGNRTKIMELSQTNEHAKKIAQVKGWIQGLYLEDDEKIEEIHKYYQGTGKLPSNRDKEIRFSDNSAAMGIWIQGNRTKIMELSQTNEHAKKIAELKGWIEMEEARSSAPNEQAFKNASEKLKSSKPSKNKKGVNNGKQI